MRIFGIVMTKNEADIIRPFLLHGKTWADRIYVYDNGSTDGTWDIVQSMADEQIIPWKSEDTPFHNNLRARVFQAFKHEAQPGDWWCFRMDADEFYVDDPRDFLAKVPNHFDFVNRIAINYQITLEDISEYPIVGDFLKDQQYIKYVLPNLGSETRFFKHKNSINWNEKSKRISFGLTYPKMITVKHYRWRSPQQIQKRLLSKYIYLQEKAIRKKQLSPESFNVTPPSSQAWKQHCPSREDLVLDYGQELLNELTVSQDSFSYNHENRFSFYFKRILKFFKIL